MSSLYIDHIIDEWGGWDTVGYYSSDHNGITIVKKPQGLKDAWRVLRGNYPIKTAWSMHDPE